MRELAIHGFERNSVLRKTYALLSGTLLWAAAMANYGLHAHFSLMGYLGVMLLSFVFLFATFAFRNSPIGILMVFAFTGLDGLSMGPVLQHYLHLHNGAHLVATAAGLTGAIFLALSALVLVTGKDFSNIGGFLFAGLIALLLASVLGLFLPLPGLQLAIAVIGALIFSGYILFDTSRIIHGGEDNYILATISLYLDIMNLFMDLMQILAAFSGNDD